MDAFLGLLGAAVGAVIFICGFYFGKNSVKTEEPVQYEATEEEMKEIREERERVLKEHQAFRELMNYNADTAYGVTNQLK